MKRSFLFLFLFVSCASNFLLATIQTGVCTYIKSKSIDSPDIVASKFVVSPVDCCQACTQVKGCLAAVFSNYYCRFKNTTIPLVEDSSAMAISLVPPTPKPTPAPTPAAPSEWAMWNVSTGVYNDTASEPDRFSSQNGVVIDSDTALQWQAAGSTAGTYTWSATAASGSAQAYCANQTTGGYSDWRLPTREELITLVDYTIPNPGPTIDATIFPNTLSNSYWTSTVYVLQAGYACLVDFGAGDVYGNAISVNFSVRCVR